MRRRIAPYCAGLSLFLWLACVLAPAQDTPRDQDNLALRAELQMLRATVDRYRARIVELEAQLQQVTAEDARIRAILARTDRGDSLTGVDNPTYLVIPVKGEIGKDFTAATMKAYLDQAVQLMPTVVLLDIDTPGGSIDETEQILSMMIELKGLRFVAYVRRALSAGAPITMVCRDIYVTETASIGAAVPLNFSARGTPQEIEEKFKSIWRASCRKAADYGRHPSVLAEAMVDPDFAVTMKEQDGKLVIERNGDGRMIKAFGRILTLTAQEAVACQLARAVVQDHAAVGTALGLKAWRAVGGEPPRTSGTTGAGLTPEGLFDQVRTLGLTKTDQTTLQAQEALKQWDDYLEKNKVVGQTVRWTLSLVEAVEDQNEVTHLERRLAAAKADLEDANKNLESLMRRPVGRVTVAPGMTAEAPGDRKAKNEAVADARKKVDQARKVVNDLVRHITDAKACPVKFAANPQGNRSILVVGRLTLASKADLAAVAPGSPVTVEGSIAGLELAEGRGHVLILLIGIDKCKVIVEKK